jgi:chemotaxis protein methyltransferase CheR
VSRVELAPHQFERVRALLDREAGLVFDESRRDSLSYSLGERLGATGARSVDEYLLMLAEPTGLAELQSLLNAVTIQETHFFRNPPQFRALRQHVLPDVVRHAAARDRRIRVWSAGCSTGEEPYSVAMLLRELLPLTDGWDIEVVATDISTRALEAARVGRYGIRALAVAPPDDVARWFIRDDEEYVVRPEVRELVRFARHNLVNDPVPDGAPFDLILCRNVTIYFSRDTTRSLMTRLHDSTRDGGYLFLGHSETLWQVNDEYRLVTLGDAFVYRRADTAGGERRTVLPDRRTGEDGAPLDGDRRAARTDRRSPVWDALTRQRSLRRPASGVALAEEARDVDPVVRVRDLLTAGDYVEAARTAALAAEAEPLRADAHYLRGLALANLGQDEQALAALRKAVYVDPGAGFAHFLLAGTLSRLGQAEAAARSYRAAAETLGRSPEDDRAAELGGRSVQELVALCRQLGRTGGGR